MRFFKILGFVVLSILSVTSSAQYYSNPAVLFAKNSNLDTYTTSDSKQIIAIIGDSKGGTSDASTGVVASANTVYEWTGASEVNITSGELAGANTGSPWVQCGKTYYTGASIKSVFVDTHSGGAEFSPNGDNNNWSATGTLRASAETKIDGAVTHYGVIPKAIFVLLGENDIRASTTIATVLTDIDAFFTWITTKYPNTDIVVMQCGKTDQVNGSANTEGSLRAHQIRSRIKQNAINTTRVCFFANGGTITTYDNLHYSAAGNIHAGRMAGNWLVNSSYSKWTRSIISSMYTKPTTTQKNVINTWVSAVNYTTGIDTFYKWRGAATETDANNDWGFEAFCTKQSLISLISNGYNTSAAGYIKTKFFGGAALLATQTDFFVGVECITQTGTSNGLFGVRNNGTTNSMELLLPSSKSFRAHDNTGTTHSGDFVDGSRYYVARDAGTKILIENTTRLTTASVAALNVDITNELFAFGRNNAGTLDNNMTGTLGFLVYGPRSVLESVFDSATQTLLTNY